MGAPVATCLARAHGLLIGADFAPERDRRRFEIRDPATGEVLASLATAASVWTRDLNKAHHPAHRLDAGALGINTHGVGDFSVPFGGYEQSGWERENGEAGLSLYTELKSITARIH